MVTFMSSTSETSKVYPARSTELITVEHAFFAMEQFLKEFWKRDPQDEDAFIRALSFIDMSDPHYRPHDPAMWFDWLNAIDEIKKRAS